eukprot:CAMPEP_0117569904 /NCGR_PEP_ID=MMETSP0784-20121206/58910_1 /TAXON_ID=39447 /ORGANISM="" /LENGTH=333 /DNA_ID=CAMNT_0005367915 /DNA_START=107 /DNA_END=1108 /DNA_ORIENTATION=-
MIVFLDGVVATGQANATGPRCVAFSSSSSSSSNSVLAGELNPATREEQTVSAREESAMAMLGTAAAAKHLTHGGTFIASSCMRGATNASRGATAVNVRNATYASAVRAAAAAPKHLRRGTPTPRGATAALRGVVDVQSLAGARTGNAPLRCVWVAVRLHGAAIAVVANTPCAPGASLHPAAGCDALWPQRNATSRGRRMQPGHEYGRVSYLARRQAAALAQSAATPANRPTPSTANSSHVLPAPWATSVSGAGADRTLAVESDIVHAVGNEGASTAPAPASVTERKSRSSTGKPHRGHRRPSRQRAQSARGPGASHWEKLQTKYQQAGCSLHS